MGGLGITSLPSTSFLGLSKLASLGILVGVPNIYLKIIAALIPLDEFREMNLPKQYGINPDREVLDILDTASKTKQVIAYIFSSFTILDLAANGSSWIGISFQRTCIYQQEKKNMPIWVYVLDPFQLS